MICFQLVSQPRTLASQQQLTFEKKVFKKNMLFLFFCASFFGPLLFVEEVIATDNDRNKSPVHRLHRVIEDALCCFFVPTFQIETQ